MDIWDLIYKFNDDVKKLGYGLSYVDLDDIDDSTILITITKNKKIDKIEKVMYI